MALLLEPSVVLVCQLGERQRCTQSRGLVEHDAEVLTHPVDGKPVVEVAI